MAKPKFTFAFLADAHKESAFGKTDAFGIFDVVNLWATPATRECSFVFGVRNLPPEGVHISCWMRILGAGRKAHKIADAEIKTSTASLSATSGFRLPLAISKVGLHEVGISIGHELGHGHALWIPLQVILLPWPAQPGGDDLRKLLADPHSIKSGRAVVVCRKCKSTYTFQVNLDPNAPIAADALPFPENGEYRCEKCNSVHYLKDIEGNLRSQLGRQGPGAAK